MLKSFHNNKRIPCIPPIFHENRFVTNFKEKAELFNSFFSKQCSIISTIYKSHLVHFPAQIQKKAKKIRPEKIPYILGNGTFLL